MRVFIDLNVLLDVVLNRPEYVRASAQVLGRLVSTKGARGYVAQHAVTTLFYLVRKQLGVEVARLAVRKVVKMLSVVAATEKILVEATDERYTDYEDAVSFLSAAAVKCDYIVTRNLADFAESEVKAVSPVEFLGLTDQS